jgi:hypothetical protein
MLQVQAQLRSSVVPPAAAPPGGRQYAVRRHASLAVRHSAVHAQGLSPVDATCKNYRCAARIEWTTPGCAGRGLAGI